MNDLRITTIRAIHDALAIRGPEHGGAGIVRTALPEVYMSEERLRLAREVLRHISGDTTVTNAEQLVAKIEPIVAKIARPEPDPPAIMFFS